MLLLSVSLLFIFSILEVSIRLLTPPNRILDSDGKGVYTPDNNLTYRMKPNFKGSFPSYEFSTEFSTNSEGFRGPEWNLSRHHKILILGDSFTAGHGVNYNESFPAVLQKSLPSWSIIGLGVAGYSQKQELPLLRKYSKIKPDIVILAYYINDPAENCGIIKRNITLTGYSQGEVTKGSESFVSRLSRTLGKVRTLSFLWQRGRSLFEYLGLRSVNPGGLYSQNLMNNKGEDCYLLTQKLISDMKSETEKIHSRFLVVIIPSKLELEPLSSSAREEYGFDPLIPIDRVLKICSE
ncbi:hypothetical protein D6764_01060, partial [Candidatus Woesearchaeota archaeon]